ncbi:MAG: PepSY domain-containing protein [Sphingomonas sp.]|nr:PepSY domain-containing protein [Sphingomonas sp.]
MTRRTLFDWHSWIGLTTGLLLFVICWSGTVAVFSRDLDGLMDRRLSAPPAAAVAWEQVYDNAQERFPGWTITQVNAPLEPGYSVESWAEDEDGILRRIYSDPATGDVIGASSYFNIQRFFRSLHMSLFIGELPVFGIPLGYFIVGLLSFPLLASGVTSLLFYSRFWRGFFRLQRHKGAKVFWSDLHKLTGLWGIWFLLMIGLTGVWYLVEWKTPDGPLPPDPPGVVAGAQPLPLDRLIANAQRAYPELRINVVSPWEIEQGLLELHGQDGSLLVRNRAARAWVNSYTGEVLAVQRPAGLTAYQRWIDTADPLHFGDFGGLWSKSVWFLFGLGLSGLCLTGAYLQAKRQRRRGLDRHRIPITIAYSTTTGLLALASVYAFKEMLTYGPDGAWPAITPAQGLFIALWLAMTIATLAVWAWKVR